VSDTFLPADRCSYWAAVIIAKAGLIYVGVIADKYLEHVKGKNIGHPSFCGFGLNDVTDHVWVIKNGMEFSDKSAMASSAGDVLLFRFDPSQRCLTIMNSRTRQATDITEVACGDPGKPLCITINMSAYHGVTQIALRQVTAAERTLLEPSAFSSSSSSSLSSSSSSSSLSSSLSSSSSSSLTFGSAAQPAFSFGASAASSTIPALVQPTSFSSSLSSSSSSPPPFLSAASYVRL
jgi:hypothetical protein